MFVTFTPLCVLMVSGIVTGTPAVNVVELGDIFAVSDSVEYGNCVDSGVAVVYPFVALKVR
jgi:hypothetical protein